MHSQSFTKECEHTFLYKNIITSNLILHVESASHLKLLQLQQTTTQ